MKPPKPNHLLIALFMCLAVSTHAQNKLSAVKVFVKPSSQERLDVIALLELDHFQEQNGAIEAEIGEEELAKLKASNYHYKVLVENVGARLQAINKPYFEGRRNGTLNIDGTRKTSAGSRVAFEQPGGLLDNIIFTPSAFQVFTTAPHLGGYYTYTQMVAAMDQLVINYPTIASKTAIGTSVQGRTIWVIKISDDVPDDDTDEPEVFFQGVQHAREAIGGSSMIFLMQYLCEAYMANDPRIVNLVNNREIFIIPCMNPDGWEYNRSTDPNGGGGWRKNRKIIASGPNQFGVDLNRNWNVDWAQCSGAVGGTSCGSGSITTGNDTYWGTAPFSEPETQAVRNFIRSHHIVVANDQHSVGPYYSLPFGRPRLHRIPDSLSIMDQQWYTHIPALMGKYNGMRAGNSVQALGYEVAGGVKDWFLMGDIGTGIGSGLKTKIYGMTGEGGHRTNSSTFWPPASEIVTLCKGMTYQNLQLIYSAGSYVDIQDMSDIALSSTTGTLDFKLKRIGLLNEQVTVTAIPLANIASVGSAVMVNLPNFYDTYNGSISYTLSGAITNGQFIRFAWKIETGGQTFYDTVTKFYNPVQLLADNMEGSFSTNWTSVSTRDSTNVNPPFNTITITGEEDWSFTTLQKFGGNRSLTESASGDYKERATRIVTYKNTLNLSDATAAYITFWTKHTAENFHDKLQVQVSTNGTTWTTVSGKTTVREPGTLEGTTINGQASLTGVKDDWVKETFNISSSIGASALRFRLVFTSDISSSFFAAEGDGFYIDDLKIIKSTASLITLPANFLNFRARLTANNTVDLDWEAEVDSKHSHFIAERSTDGRNYILLGRVDNLPYKLTDYNPAIGNNYYRIKQFDVDGKFTYSKVNVIYLDPSRMSMVMYPNPANENITFRVNTGRREMITISISDLAGKVVYTEQMLVTGSSAEMKVNVQGWPSQTYIVKAIRNDNSTLSVQKFIKQ